MQKKLSILKYLKNRMAAIVFLILAIALLFLYLLFQVIVHDGNIINTHSLLFTIILALSALGVIIVLLFNAYRYLFLPLEQLYAGMAKMGMTKFDFKYPGRVDKALVPVFTEVNEIFMKLNRLILLIENINQNDSFEEILQYIYSTFSVFIPYTYIGIALIEDDGKSIKASYGISDETVNELGNDLLGHKVSIDETSLGDVIKTGKVRVINDLEMYCEGKPVKEYNRVILKNGIRSSITLPLKINQKPVGVIFFSSTGKNIYTKEHVLFLKTLANSIAISFHKNIMQNDLLFSSILALAKLAESRDSDTGEHLQRMKVYSGMIAELLAQDSKYSKAITPEYIQDIEKFSSLHDIGKVSIRDDILLKPGRLTPAEFEIMKFHTVYGAVVLKEADRYIKKNGKSYFKTGIEIVEGHHEKWDGSGYPKGMKGEDIPLSARIIALSDVFDALTSKRPYKEAYSFEKASDIIAQGKGTHFDPEIVKVFLENKDKFYEVYMGFSSKD